MAAVNCDPITPKILKGPLAVGSLHTSDLGVRKWGQKNPEVTGQDDLLLEGQVSFYNKLLRD